MTVYNKLKRVQSFYQSHTIIMFMSYLVTCKLSYAKAQTSDGPHANEDTENADDFNALFVVPSSLSRQLWIIIIIINLPQVYRWSEPLHISVGYVEHRMELVVWFLLLSQQERIVIKSTMNHSYKNSCTYIATMSYVVKSYHQCMPPSSSPGFQYL